MSQTFAGADSEQSRVIMHIDMDCFFASVTMRTRPELKDKPFVVCFAAAGSDRPVGEISSASYPARDFGIRAGMMSREALHKCPHLIGVPYEFEQYEDVSDTIYEIFARIVGYESGRIEAVSCDEAYLDLSGLDLKTNHRESSQPSPTVSPAMPTPSWDVDRLEWAEAWATRVRSEVSAATGCTASAGLGSNKLLARLATAAAKPDGQRVLLEPADVAEHLGALPVRQLPGLGYKGRRKLEEELGISQDMTVAAVRDRVTEESLKRVLGPSYGTSLMMMMHGKDERALETQHLRKSYSAEVNWGVRFDAGDATKVRKFIQDISDYVSEELQHLGLLAGALAIKIKRRKKNATTPYKMLGHGPCDNFSKTTNLGVATSDATIIGREAARLYASIHPSIPPNDLRGAGIMMTKLVPAADDQKAGGMAAMTSYFRRVDKSSASLDAPAAAGSSGAHGEGAMVDEGPEGADARGAGYVDNDEDILASQIEVDGDDDTGRPSFSQTLDPETLSQQSSELRADSVHYDEEAGAWKGVDEEPSTDIGGTERQSSDGGLSEEPPVAEHHASDESGTAEAQVTSSDISAASRVDVDSSDASRSSMERDDFIPRLSQVDPEIMAALGSDWASICVAELSDNQQQRDSLGNTPSRAAGASVVSGESMRPSTRMDPPPARSRAGYQHQPSITVSTVHARTSSPRRAMHSDGGGPSHKRRKPAQQTLLGMQQNTAKWSQLQQWAASDPDVGEVLRGMSKEEQLAMYDDLKQARSASASSASGIAQPQQRAERSDASGGGGRPAAVASAGATAAAASGGGTMTQQDAAFAQRLQREEEDFVAARDDTRQHRGGVAAFDDNGNGGDAWEMDEAPQVPAGRVEQAPAQAAARTADTRARAAAGSLPAATASNVAAATSVIVSSVHGVVDDGTSSRMFRNEVDREELNEACARLVTEMEAPCENTLDVLSLGFWQMIEDRQLAEAESWLKFFRRLISGSEWRAPASLEWTQGFNALLERCQQLVHERYGSFLQIAQVPTV